MEHPIEEELDMELKDQAEQESDMEQEEGEGPVDDDDEESQVIGNPRIIFSGDLLIQPNRNHVIQEETHSVAATPFIDGGEGEETREGCKNNRYPADAPNLIPRQ